MLVKTDIFCGSRMRAARIINDISLDDLAASLNMEKRNCGVLRLANLFPQKTRKNLLQNLLMLSRFSFIGLKQHHSQKIV